MAYNASTNSLQTRSSPSVITVNANAPALNIDSLFSVVAATGSLVSTVLQSTTSQNNVSLNAPALTGIQMTQISGPTPNYTIVQIISPVQSWGS